MGRNRRPGGLRQRQVDVIPERTTILIVCEGEKTEPNYFKAFRVSPRIVRIEGLGANTLSLVNTAQQIDEEEGPFEQVWCVFDRDSFPSHNFDNAIMKASSCGYHTAYSNEAFELWYVLHFRFIDSALGREQYVKILKEELGEYKKSSTRIYDILLSRQENAIKNAKQLLARHTQLKPSADSPSTTVHLLVSELNRHLR